MKEMDCVEVVAEKNRYAKEGVHKGMQGWICDSRKIAESWLVNFPQCGEKGDIATLDIKEEDLKLVPIMNAAVNEEIKAQFERSESAAKGLEKKSDNLSDYLI